jgi:hypothetical protein
MCSQSFRECILLFSEFYVFCGRCYKEIGIAQSYSFRNSKRDQFDLSLALLSSLLNHNPTQTSAAGPSKSGGLYGEDRRIEGVESGEVSGGKGRNGQAKGKYNQPKPNLLQLIEHPHPLKPGVPTPK